jgi:Tfp pilus assembly protein PilF
VNKEDAPAPDVKQFMKAQQLMDRRKYYRAGLIVDKLARRYPKSERVYLLYIQLSRYQRTAPFLDQLKAAAIKHYGWIMGAASIIAIFVYYRFY